MSHLTLVPEAAEPDYEMGFVEYVKRQLSPESKAAEAHIENVTMYAIVSNTYEDVLEWLAESLAGDQVVAYEQLVLDTVWPRIEESRALVLGA